MTSTQHRYEIVEEEPITEAVAEPVEEEEEVVAEVEEIVGEGYEVVGTPATGRSGVEDSPLSIIEQVYYLPPSVSSISKLARRFAVYGTCIVELRDKLRKLKKLDIETRRLIDAELRYVRVWLYLLTLKAMRIVEADGVKPNAICSVLGRYDPVLGKLCARIRGKGVPKYVEREARRGNPGASNPTIILALLKHYHPKCYDVIVSGKYSSYKAETRTLLEKE